MPSNKIIDGNPITDADPLQVQDVGAAAINTAIGSAADVPFVGTEDATARTGISLLKGIKNILYDALGTAADVIVAAGAVGSISAKLRRLTQGVEDLKSLISLGPGEAHLGEVGGKIVAISDSFTRPANATPYTVKDAVGPATKAITGVTNTTPAVVTSAGHGLSNGDVVLGAGVGGSTGVNALMVVTNKATDTFEAYAYVSGGPNTPIAAGGAFSGAGTFIRLGRLANIARKVGGSGTITFLSFETDNKADTSMYRIWFYNAPVSPYADNLEFGRLYARAAARIGYLDISGVAQEGTTASTSAGGQNTDTPFDFVCDTGIRDIFYEVEILASPTPASGQQYTMKVKARND
jgi:hypothetical protein